MYIVVEAKLVEAREAITLKDGELEDLRSQVDEAIVMLTSGSSGLGTRLHS